jgi:hypothetical protein
MNIFKKEKSILVVDLTYLPTETKTKEVDKITEELKEKYKCNVFLIDSSKQNIMGTSNSYGGSPVYFIR